MAYWHVIHFVRVGCAAIDRAEIADNRRTAIKAVTGKTHGFED